jgi:glutamate-1-semialdehyde 2,1-aminomutase
MAGLTVSEFVQSERLRERTRRLIPGGAHTYAKGDDQYPVLAPGFIERGEGCRVWDVDGNEFIEYGMGNRTVGLGHAFAPVVDAAIAAMKGGCNFVRPARIEADCAETLLRMIHGAEMVKFCKDGSDATSGAVRLARAYTGRDLVGCCSDHPFFSTDDWFIGTTPMNAGVPRATRRLTLTFRYNDIASVEALFLRYPRKIAALIMEPARSEEPVDGFLHRVQEICRREGTLFILDEMITGFRWHASGGQHFYDIVPDLSCFGKAMGNGFSLSALAGKREFMRLGGLDHSDMPRVFLLSTTHGAETHAMAAGIATMEIYRTQPVIEHLNRQGSRLKAGMEEAARRRGIDAFVHPVGRPCCLTYATLDRDGNPSQSYRSLLLQETIRRGILMPSLVVSYTHQDADIDYTLEAIDGALEVYARALEDNGAERYLVGRPSQMVYRRFNNDGQPPRMASHRRSA